MDCMSNRERGSSEKIQNGKSGPEVVETTSLFPHMDLQGCLF